MKTNKTINIRPSSSTDAAAVFALYRAVADIPGGLARLSFEISMDYVEHFLHAATTRGVGFVAVESGPSGEEIVAEIHGYSPEIFCFSHVLTDLTIAVTPRQQGSGLGRRLFSHFLRAVDEQRPHISRIELFARESNTRALAFYESLGFEREGAFRDRVLNSDGSLESDIPMARLRT